LVRRISGSPRICGAHPSMDAYPMNMKKKILVVDDEPDYCTLVRRILEKAGFEVDVAYDGRECLQKVRANPPDAIVLDVVMPEADGHAVCKALKANRLYCHIPIIILTAETPPIISTRFSRDRMMYSDADDYLPKPASAEEITSSVKNLLNR
jgi:two-component system, OmpR family, alkaline phosphatase synthesis response regulator PhoP